jgi:nucleoside-diphosphate-sugar epimerase
MKVFITGGTGYIGRHVVRELVGRGDDVRALVRSDEAANQIEALGATPVRGELTDAAVLRDAAADADAAIHLANTGDSDAGEADRIASAAIQEGLAGRTYVHTGGCWIFGNTHGEAGEDAEAHPPALTAWRVANEAAVMERGNAVLVMPGVVYGEDTGLIPMTYGEGRYVGNGTYKTALVHVEDAAHLFVLALDAPHGSAFNGVAECVQAIEIARALRPDDAAPETLEEAEARLGPLAEAMTLDQELSSARAREQLGWEPAHTDARAELRAAATRVAQSPQ